MDWLTLMKGVTGLADNLLALFTKTEARRLAKREALASFAEEIARSLATVSASLRNGEVPHGECARIETVAGRLPEALAGAVAPEEADKWRDLLVRSHNVEGMVAELNRTTDIAPYLAEIDQAAGRFSALAMLLRLPL
jgi:hypothetical protein